MQVALPEPVPFRGLQRCHSSFVAGHKVHTLTHTHTHTHTHTQTHARTHAHAHTHTHSHTHARTHTHTHTHAHTHTHTRTHARALTRTHSRARWFASVPTHARGNVPWRPRGLVPAVGSWGRLRGVSEPTNESAAVTFFGGKQFYRSEQVADSGPSPRQSTSSLLVRVRMCVPVHVCACVCRRGSLVAVRMCLCRIAPHTCASLESEPSPSARALSLRLLPCLVLADCYLRR